MQARVVLSVLILIIILQFQTSCKNPEKTFRIESIDSTTKAEKISYLELAENYPDYHAKYVDVEGRFGAQFEHFGLCPERSTHKGLKCVWLSPDNKLGLTENDIKRMNHQLVRLKGFFDTSGKGHLSAYYGTIRKIYFWEAK